MPPTLINPSRPLEFFSKAITVSAEKLVRPRGHIKVAIEAEFIKNFALPDRLPPFRD